MTNVISVALPDGTVANIELYDDDYSGHQKITDVKYVSASPLEKLRKAFDYDTNRVTIIVEMRRLFTYITDGTYAFCKAYDVDPHIAWALAGKVVEAEKTAKDKNVPEPNELQAAIERYLKKAGLTDQPKYCSVQIDSKGAHLKGCTYSIILSAPSLGELITKMNER